MKLDNNNKKRTAWSSSFDLGQHQIFRSLVRLVYFAEVGLLPRLTPCLRGTLSLGKTAEHADFGRSAIPVKIPSPAK